MSSFSYPPAKRDQVIDDYHGTPVADPYRWMEDPDAEAVKTWVDAENTLTQDYLAEIPARQTLNAGLTELWDFARFSSPTRREDQYFFEKNDGLQNQSILYQQTGLDGTPTMLLDPNTLSDDGTVALVNYRFDEAGKHMAYSVSSGGSDWQTIHIRNVESGEDLDEVLEHCKFAGIAWLEDGSGFFYNRFPEPGTIEDSDQGAYHNRLYFHQLGTPQAEDQLIYARSDAKELNFHPTITHDYAYIVLYVWHGAINRNRIYYRDLDGEGDFIRLIDTPDAEYGFVGSDGPVFYFLTDLDAPKGRLIAIDTTNPARKNWRTVIAENDDTLLDVRIINEQFVLLYLHNAYHQVKLATLDGDVTDEIALPGIGQISSITGRRQHQEMFIQFQSFLYAPTVFCYDFTTKKLSTWQQGETTFPVDDYTTEQIFLPSKDGTQVPVFVTHRKGITLDGSNPTLLYAYGGFSISMTPTYTPYTLNWLKLGGVYAVAILRGGGEFGEEWHQAGMLGNKQNVFDDFIAAAEGLIAQKYTSREKLAIMGGSNGGLLVAACMLQKPELYGAVICHVPVTDMLRYHKFTAGRYWTPEYGNAEEDPEHFKFLYAYSPVHNVKPGVAYPPTMILTADHDDRVVPMHAMKFAATLQAADAGNSPLLLRFDTRSGHGLGKPTTKLIEQWADVQAFLVRSLKMDV